MKHFLILMKYLSSLTVTFSTTNGVNRTYCVSLLVFLSVAIFIFLLLLMFIILVVNSFAPDLTHHILKYLSEVLHGIN